MRDKEAGRGVRWVERTVMEFGSSHDGVPAGGGRDSLRLPWRSRAGKSQHLLSMKHVEVENKQKKRA
jgi:hypothetical protein